jgi:hypothetical protein
MIGDNLNGFTLIIKYFGLDLLRVEVVVLWILFGMFCRKDWHYVEYIKERLELFHLI